MDVGKDNRYLTVAEAVQNGLYPNEGGLRWLIFNSRRNGLEKVLRRVGRRVLLDEAAFHDWMKSQAIRND